jgi:cystathionine beta-lyase
LVFTESPGSQTFEIQDLPAIAKAAHDHGAIVLMDNTWGAGVFFKALAHGADVAVHAGTKYFAGHSDVMIGAIVCNQNSFRQIKTFSDLQPTASAPTMSI